MVGPALEWWTRKGKVLQDRLLHGLRRQLALRALAAARPSSVVFVCDGNVCRSPYAERALRRAIPEPFGAWIRVSSMGLLWPGHSAAPVAQACAAAHGVDLSDHVSAAFDYRGGAPDELLVVMTAQQRRQVRHRSARERRILLLGDLDPRSEEGRDIADPVDQPSEVFEACYARIDRCVRELARALTVPVADGRGSRRRR